MNVNNKILSDITVHMKYAKFIPELNRRETWEELVTRNKEMHQKKYPDLYNEIEENYRYVYKKKVLPSMRSLQFSGKPLRFRPIDSITAPIYLLITLIALVSLCFYSLAVVA